MRYDAQSVRKRRTEEERKRRHLHGDSGAVFSTRRLLLGGDTMTALTTFYDKDNIIFEISWI